MPSNATLKMMMSLHQVISHIQNVELRNYQVVDNLEEQNLDLRIKYMLDKVDEPYWKKQLQIREKARDKKLAVFQVLDMYSQTMTDLFRNLLGCDKDQLKTIKKEMIGLKTYVNEQFEVLRKRYNNVIPRIKDDFKYCCR
jgi:hypothetical protein